MWQVEVTRRAQKELLAIPRPMLARIEAAIADLAQNPRPPGSVKLQGEEIR